MLNSTILIADNYIIANEFSYHILWTYEANAGNMARNAPQKTINVTKPEKRTKIVFWFGRFILQQVPKGTDRYRKEKWETDVTEDV